ncbi:IS701 family transposase [Glycomyces sp. A-F 0318]|uniref:IS701 family transposase n=1 Tax=Glycomyces amatae TaxID=2881355 RepID=UPI001E5C3CF8|nr:IS701 family transposase [Glycomyces amatae]MCD0444240.1 IS701 family transposase [Glycomyces amatae]
MARIAPAFARIETRQNAKRLTQAMMAHLERRNCWTLAEHAGETGPWRFQHLLSRARWDDARIRSETRAWASEHLSTGAGPRVLAVDETGDLKKGTATVGVQRQYSGTAGRIENCQLAVYLALAAAGGHAAVDVRLYMPKAWTDDPARCAAAGVPEQVGFATKPRLAGDMIEAALDAGIGADFAVGDEAYGINPELRRQLQRRRLSYVLAVACTTPVTVAAGKTTAAATLEQAGVAWQNRSTGNDAKGLRRYDWAWIDLVGEGEGHAHLLARRNRRTGELAYYLTWTAAPVPLQTLVTVAGMRWRIEETFQGAKELAGLDEHQVRTWTSWHRWITLAMLAYAFLAVARARETDSQAADMIPLTCNEIRHLLISAIAPDLDWLHRLRWSTWRRHHQATAKRLHYQRQLALAA